MFKYWRILLGFVVAAFFVPSVTAAPAAEAAPGCPQVQVEGLHGLNEGSNLRAKRQPCPAVGRRRPLYNYFSRN